MLHALPMDGVLICLVHEVYLVYVVSLILSA